MKKTVAYVIAEVQFAPTFEWLAESALARELDLIFYLMNPGPSPLEDKLRTLGCRVERIPYAGSRQVLGAFWRLFREFRKHRPTVVHTHLLSANLAGLPAAWLARVPRRIYTRHHTNLNTKWNESGPWYAPFYDYVTNFLSTEIVATCLNVRSALQGSERVHPEKIKVIHFGFEEKNFDVPPERLATVQRKYALEGHWPVIGMVSRYLPLKGVPFAIDAFASLLEEYPNACLVLANAGHGAARAEIQRKLSDLPPESYREIQFETDCPALMRTFDIFVHVPVDKTSEAFGQVYVEAMLSERPSVFTMSGVAPEIVRHGENAIVVPFESSAAILEAVRTYLASDSLRHQVGKNARSSAAASFGLSKMIDGLRELYQ